MKIQRVSFGQQKTGKADKPEPGVERAKTAQTLAGKRATEVQGDISSRRRKKFRSFVGYTLLSLAWLGGIGGAGYKGVTGLQEYSDSKGVVSEWKGLLNWSKEAQAEKATYNYDLATLQEFQGKVKEYMGHFAQDLAQNPDPAMQELAKRINFDAVVAQNTIDQVGLELFQYIAKQRAANGPLDIRGFFETNSASASLTSREKEYIANTIYNLVNENPDIKVEKFSLKEVTENRLATAKTTNTAPTAERKLRDLLEVYIGNKIHGLDIDTFASLETMNTQTQALAFYEKLVTSSNVLGHLSSQERQAFLQFGKEQISRYDYEKTGLRHGGGYGFLVHALLGLAGLLSLTGLVKISKSMKRATAARREKLNQDQKLLKIIRGEQWPDATARFTEKCAQLARIRETVALRNGELKPLIDASLEAVSSQRLSPERRQGYHTDMIKMIFESVVHEKILADGHRTVKADTYYQAAEALVDAALEKQEFFPELQYALPEQSSQAATGIKAAKSEEEVKIWKQIQSIEGELPTARRIYLNQLVVVDRAREEMEVHAKELEQLETDRSKGGTTPSLERKIEQATLMLSNKRVLYDNALKRQQEAHDTLNSCEDQRMTCQMLIIDQRDHQAFQSAMRELDTLKANRQRVETNPGMTEIRREADIQRHIRDTIITDDQARARAQQLIEDHLNQSAS